MSEASQPFIFIALTVIKKKITPGLQDVASLSEDERVGARVGEGHLVKKTGMIYTGYEH